MYIKIAPQPGLSKDGTEYQSEGGWWDQSLTRWYGTDLGPIGGWQSHSAGLFTGACRNLFGWLALSGGAHLAGGTEQGLFHMGAGGGVGDITPSGFVTGIVDSVAGTGFGGGSYGSGIYGAPRPDEGVTSSASVWDLDNYGDRLIGCMSDDGAIYAWSPPDTSILAVAVVNAPTSCLGCFVTGQRALVAYGSGGDGRNVAWSDLEDITDWTPTSENQAGSFDINSEGTIIRGLRVGSDNLIITTVDCHLMTYEGPPFIYGFTRIGSGCGAMSKGCVVNMGQEVIWWGRGGFWQYNGGAVSPIDCDIGDFLRTGINREQRAKISGWHNQEFNEVWWFYPSASSIECDSYVSYNYLTGKWGRGTLARLAGLEKGIIEFPLAVDITGKVWEHEVGQNYHQQEVFAETGPIELGNGDQVFLVNGIIADERTIGACQITFKTRDFPNSGETVTDPVVLGGDGYAGYADLRFAARQIKMHVTFNTGGNSRFGTARLDFEQGGRR